MKKSVSVFLALFLVTVSLFFSCKQKNTNRYAYDANKDTIPPVLNITVPVNLDTYTYGEDIHIVGTVTDLESKNSISMKSGRLRSLYLNISIIDPIADTATKVLLIKTPNVDGKDGYTINEKTFLNSGVGTTYCKFTGVAIDYSDRKDSSVVYFTIN